MKYKRDELIIYYRDELYIDLSTVNSLLSNMVKEMSQGVLLDKIYLKRDIDLTISIIRLRKFEDEYVRSQFRKFKNNNNKPSNDCNYK